MPMLQYLMLGTGYYITKIDGSKPVSDLMKEIKVSDEFRRFPYQWADLQLYTTRDTQQDEPGRFLTVTEALNSKMLWDNTPGQRLGKLDTYMPHHLRMKSTQRIGFYFPDVGERSNGDVHLLVVFSREVSAFHGSRQVISSASEDRWLRKRALENKERRKLAQEK